MRKFITFIIFLLIFPACAEEIPLTPEEMPEMEWQSENTVPPGGDLIAIWGTSARNVTAIGYHRRVLRFDGDAWTEQIPESDPYVRDVWFRSPDDVFAAGSPTVHFDGNDWSVLDTGEFGSTVAVWATSAFVYFVTGGARVIRYDGAGFVETNDGVYFQGRDIWGSDPDDIYVVGDWWDPDYHYDGAAWSPVEFGVEDVDARLYCVAGASAGNVLMSGERTVHFDGTQWTGISHGSHAAVSELWCAGPDDYYGTARDQVLHFDGSAWRPVFGLPDYTQNWSLRGVWKDPDDGLFAVGNHGDVWRHYGGETTLFNRSAITIASMWASSEDDVYAGADGGAWLRFDGENWSYQERFTDRPVYEIWGTSAEDVYAVDGADLFHSDGVGWTRVDDAPRVRPLGVWRAEEGDLFLAGRDGVAVRGDRGWSVLGVSMALHCVWGRNSQDVFAAGGYTLLHFDGRVWSPVAHEMGIISDLWGHDRRSIYAATDWGLYRHRNGEWRRVENAPMGSLRSVWGTADNDLYITSGGGSLMYHYYGSDRDWIYADDTHVIYALWGTSKTNVFTGGADGVLQRYAGAGTVK